MRYRKIDPRIWNDQKFRSFSDDAKLAFLFLLTHPSLTALGAMRASLAGLAAELGWAEQKLSEALDEAVKEKMVEVNTQASYIALPNFLKYNPPESPNSVRKGWIDALDLIPECPEKHDLIARCHTYIYGLSSAMQGAIGEAVMARFDSYSSTFYGMGDPETKTKTGVSNAIGDPGAGAGAGAGAGITASDSSSSPSSSADHDKPIPKPIPAWGTPEAFVNLWNQATPEESPAIENLSNGRREKIRAALKQYPTLKFWQEVMAEFHRSRFLRGLKSRSPGHESFEADLDWLLQRGKNGAENFVKVHEGKYRD